MNSNPLLDLSPFDDPRGGPLPGGLIPSPTRGRPLLLVAPTSAAALLSELVARLALQGPLYVLDGGNIFQGYGLARALRGLMERAACPLPLEEVMGRVRLSRAFTCYQMATLLAEQVFDPHPVVILDLLSSFYDQNVRVCERRRLLGLCLRQVQHMSSRAPVAVWARQRRVIPEDSLSFLGAARAAAGQVWQPEPLPPPPILQQPPLF